MAEVSLVYRPDRTYRIGLLVGLALVVLLLAGAALSQLRDRHRPRPDSATRSHRARSEDAGRAGRIVTVAGLLVLGGPVAGSAYAVAALPRLRNLTWVLGGLLVVASAVLAATSDTARVGSPGVAANLAAAAGAGLLVGSAQVSRARAPKRWSSRSSPR